MTELQLYNSTRDYDGVAVTEDSFLTIGGLMQSWKHRLKDSNKDFGLMIQDQHHLCHWLDSSTLLGDISLGQHERLVVQLKSKKVSIVLPDDSEHLMFIPFDVPTSVIVERLCSIFGIWPANLWGIFVEARGEHVMLTREFALATQASDTRRFLLKQFLFPANMPVNFVSPVAIYGALYASMFRDGKFVILPKEKETIEQASWYSYCDDRELSIGDLRQIVQLKSFGMLRYRVRFTRIEKGKLCPEVFCWFSVSQKKLCVESNEKDGVKLKMKTSEILKVGTSDDTVRISFCDKSFWIVTLHQSYELCLIIQSLVDGVDWRKPIATDVAKTYVIDDPEECKLKITRMASPDESSDHIDTAKEILNNIRGNYGEFAQQKVNLGRTIQYLAEVSQISGEFAKIADECCHLACLIDNPRSDTYYEELNQKIRKLESLIPEDTWKRKAKSKIFDAILSIANEYNIETVRKIENSLASDPAVRLEVSAVIPSGDSIDIQKRIDIVKIAEPLIVDTTDPDSSLRRYNELRDKLKAELDEKNSEPPELPSLAIPLPDFQEDPRPERPVKRSRTACSSRIRETTSIRFADTGRNISAGHKSRKLVGNTPAYEPPSIMKPQTPILRPAPAPIPLYPSMRNLTEALEEKPVNKKVTMKKQSDMIILNPVESKILDSISIVKEQSQSKALTQNSRLFLDDSDEEIPAPVFRTPQKTKPHARFPLAGASPGNSFTPQVHKPMMRSKIIDYPVEEMVELLKEIELASHQGRTCVMTGQSCVEIFGYIDKLHEHFRLFTRKRHLTSACITGLVRKLRTFVHMDHLNRNMVQLVFNEVIQLIESVRAEVTEYRNLKLEMRVHNPAVSLRRSVVRSIIPQFSY